MTMEFASQYRIEAPAQKVFGALTNLEGAREWMPNFISIERLDDGEVGVGTQWRETRKMFGRESTEVFEITHCEAPKRVDVFVDGCKGSSKKGEYHFRYDLTPQGAATDLRMHGRIEVEGWFANLMGKLFAGSFKKMCDKDMKALKRYIESSR